jgi:hypothetical protein
MKRLFFILALLSLAIGVAAWIAWSQNLLPDAGPNGEHWERWNSAINVTWTIMEISLPASVVFGVAYLVVKPRSQRAISCGIGIVVLALVAIVLIWFIMTHLGIS